MSILDQPKFLLFMIFTVLVLTIIGGLCNGVMQQPDTTNHDSPWYQLQHGNYLAKIAALGRMWFWDYPWLTGALEYIAWIPFRVVNIVFTLLLVIAGARLARELLPIP
jgi:hypothetical protein